MLSKTKAAREIIKTLDRYRKIYYQAKGCYPKEITLNDDIFRDLGVESGYEYKGTVLRS